jgi:hypothetical protein
MRRRSIQERAAEAPFKDLRCLRCYPALAGVSAWYSGLGAGSLRVTHPYASGALLHPIDLHVLGTPPAFILSQDRTLKRE